MKGLLEDQFTNLNYCGRIFLLSENGEKPVCYCTAQSQIFKIDAMGKGVNELSKLIMTLLYT